MRDMQGKLSQARESLGKEQADARDASLISSGLTARIDTLRAQQVERSQRSPAQTAKELLRALQSRKQQHDAEVRRLVKAFNGFVDTRLAPMLAAEELGGPVVGDMLGVDDEMLESGFATRSGRAKKPRRASHAAEDDSVQRQQRIDQIWGPVRTAQSASASDEEDDRDYSTAAASELRALTEELLNSSALSGGGTSAYVDLARDSAAARFLVRAKVAQFHPRDARRLRLVDFGRVLDD